MGYYVNCPFYVSSARRGSTTIVCEDTHRDFGTLAKKNWQLEHVCQDDWKSCIYAQALTALYERMDGMNLTRREKEHLQHTCEAQKAEMIKLKKRMKLAERHLEKKDRDEKAALHLADVKSKQVAQLQERVMIKEEQERGLLALIGYMANKTGIKDFSLNQVQRYGKAYETMCRVDTETADDGVEEIKRVYIEQRPKEDLE